MTNKDRADRARRAIAAYQGSDNEFYLGDLIADLGHWRDAYGADNDMGENASLENACWSGMRHYGEEVADELD